VDPAPSSYLLRLVGAVPGDDGERSVAAEAGAGSGDAAARVLQSRTFAALQQWICGAGRGGLAIVEIEDLHWADATSEELLSFLVEGLTGTPLLLLLTYRPGYQPR